MDNNAAQELNRSLHQLTEKVAVLSERMQMLQPVLDDQKNLLNSQTAGLVDLANRMSRTEDRISVMKEMFDKRETAFRWAVGTSIALAALILPLVLYVLPHVKWQ